MAASNLSHIWILNKDDEEAKLINISKLTSNFMHLWKYSENRVLNL